MTATGRQPEFDRYAKSYHELHTQSVRISGEEPDYFARYKIDEVARVSAVARRLGGDLAILDFGCGIGGSIPHFRRLFPRARLSGADVSEESLAMAREQCPPDVQFEAIDGECLPFESQTFDIVFTSCVFHHIAPEERLACMREIQRVLKPGGEFFFFEHNPWNPLTVRVVRDCPFDENAILLDSPEAMGLVNSAGFSSARLSYTVFFPKVLSILRPLEKFFRLVPIGAQYYIRANA